MKDFEKQYNELKEAVQALMEYALDDYYENWVSSEYKKVVDKILELLK